MEKKKVVAVLGVVGGKVVFGEEGFMVVGSGVVEGFLGRVVTSVVLPGELVGGVVDGGTVVTPQLKLSHGITFPSPSQYKP